MSRAVFSTVCLGLLAGPGPAAAQQTAGGVRALSQSILNPNISVVADFTGAAEEGTAPEDPFWDRFTLRETEVGLQAYVDPYARADFFLAFEDEVTGFEADLEEGYVTLLHLPGGFQARGGRIKTSFGKINRIHDTEIIQGAFYPAMLRNFFGEEGWAEMGVSVSRILPAPGDVFLEGTFELLNGENAISFAGSASRDPVLLSHVKYYRDLTENANLEVGLSGATGFNDAAGMRRTTIEGLDVTVRWKPLREAIYKSFILQGELLASQREAPREVVGSLAGYLFGQWQLARRWFVGSRFDYSESALREGIRERTISGLLSFWPSEFHRLRAEVRRQVADQGGRWQGVLQWTITLGPHRPEPF